MRLPHIAPIIIYTINGTALKHQEKSNEAQYIVIGAQCFRPLR